MVSAAFYYTLELRVSDPHHLNADPDPPFHFNANPDSDPALHFKEVSDPAPHQGDENLRPLPSKLPGLHFEPLGLYCEHPGPSKALFQPLVLQNFYFNADLDPASKNNADPDPQPWMHPSPCPQMCAVEG
jgi:hypothetical protein